MTGKFFLTWLLAFVVWMVGSFLAHGVLLSSQYAKLANLFRQPAESQQYFHFMVLAHILMAGAFTWIDTRGVEAFSTRKLGRAHWPEASQTTARELAERRVGV